MSAAANWPHDGRRINILFGTWRYMAISSIHRDSAVSGASRSAVYETARAIPPRRILFVDHTATMGGGEIALLNLATSLDRTNYEPIVLLCSEGPLSNRLRDAGIETHFLPLAPSVVHTRKDNLNFASILRIRDLVRISRYIVTLARFIRRHQIDIVHTNSLKADVIGGVAARLARRPALWHIRDRIEDDYLPKSVVRIFRLLCRYVPTYVVANSNATLQTIHLTKKHRAAAVYSGLLFDGVSDVTDPITDGKKHRSRVVHDGISTSQDRDRPFSLNGSVAPIVGIIGRISPWKGQHIFLQAAAQVRDRFPNVRFQIVGAALFNETEYEEEIRLLCEKLGLDACVEFTGFRSDVNALLTGMEIVVHASTTPEPFGQVVTEGMAASKPVVATRGGGVIEVVQDGETGILVPMGDAHKMAEAICHLLSSPEAAREMGRKGRERVHKQFSIQRCARLIETVYEEIISGSTDLPARATSTVPPLAIVDGK